MSAQAFEGHWYDPNGGPYLDYDPNPDPAPPPLVAGVTDWWTNAPYISGTPYKLNPNTGKPELIGTAKIPLRLAADGTQIYQGEQVPESVAKSMGTTFVPYTPEMFAAPKNDFDIGGALLQLAAGAAGGLGGASSLANLLGGGTLGGIGAGAITGGLMGNPIAGAIGGGLGSLIPSGGTGVDFSGVGQDLTPASLNGGIDVGGGAMTFPYSDPGQPLEQMAGGSYGGNTTMTDVPTSPYVAPVTTPYQDFGQPTVTATAPAGTASNPFPNFTPSIPIPQSTVSNQVQTQQEQIPSAAPAIQQTPAAPADTGGNMTFDDIINQLYGGATPDAGLDTSAILANGGDATGGVTAPDYGLSDSYYGAPSPDQYVDPAAADTGQFGTPEAPAGTGAPYNTNMTLEKMLQELQKLPNSIKSALLGPLGAAASTNQANTGRSNAALQRIMNGTGTPEDWLSVSGQAIPGLLGAYASNQQTNALKDLATKYEGYGAPSRARYEASMTPGFDPTTIPGYSGALQTTSDSLLRRLSAQNGNPYGNPGGLIEANKQIVNGTALPAVQQYQNQNANTGGLGALASASTAAQTAAIGSSGDIWAGLGRAAKDVTLPQSTSLADLYKLINTGTVTA